MKLWIRICQECGHKNLAIRPLLLKDTYLNAKCKKCKSEALDYGKYEEMSKK